MKFIDEFLNRIMQDSELKKELEELPTTKEYYWTMDSRKEKKFVDCIGSEEIERISKLLLEALRNAESREVVIQMAVEAGESIQGENTLWKGILFSIVSSAIIESERDTNNKNLILFYKTIVDEYSELAAEMGKVESMLNNLKGAMRVVYRKWSSEDKSYVGLKV